MKTNSSKTLHHKLFSEHQGGDAYTTTLRGGTNNSRLATRRFAKQLRHRRNFKLPPTKGKIITSYAMKPLYESMMEKAGKKLVEIQQVTTELFTKVGMRVPTAEENAQFKALAEAYKKAEFKALPHMFVKIKGRVIQSEYQETNQKHLVLMRAI